MNKTFPVTASHEITLQQISDLLVTAFEGGSNYWVSSVHYTMPVKTEFLPDGAMNPKAQPRYAYVPLNEGGSILIKGDGMPEWKFLNMETIKSGIVLLGALEWANRHLVDIMNDNADAETADAFLQLCIFGELVYS